MDIEIHVFVKKVCLRLFVLVLQSLQIVEMRLGPGWARKGVIQIGTGGNFNIFRGTGGRARDPCPVVSYMLISICRTIWTWVCSRGEEVKYVTRVREVLGISLQK